jgi:hypothetical protein
VGTEACSCGREVLKVVDQLIEYFIKHDRLSEAEIESLRLKGFLEPRSTSREFVVLAYDSVHATLRLKMPTEFVVGDNVDFETNSTYLGKKIRDSGHIKEIRNGIAILEVIPF